MQIRFAAPDASFAGQALGLMMGEGEGPGPAAQAFDAASDGALRRALAVGRFKGGKGQGLDLAAPAGEGAPLRVWVAGVGPRASLDALGVEAAAASAFQALKGSGAETLTLAFDLSADLAARTAYAVGLAAYRFDRYRTREKPDAKPTVNVVQVLCDDPAAAEAAYQAHAAVAEGVVLARDLVSEPPNVLQPGSYAERLQALTASGLEVKVLGEPEMEALGMGSLLAVGHASVHASRLVVMRWSGGDDPAAAPLAFVGKGVTFDTGGVSLKPADGMDEMKTDMGGSAAVAGLMLALASRKAKVNAVGVVGLVENMMGGGAMRPGDVLTSMSGQTIEVLNTDAEGRLVLADALWYAQDRFKPRLMVDLATLTGAIVVSLGNDYAGLFSNDDALSAGLLAAGEAEGETLWRMPLPPAYDKLIDSPIADMKNIGGRAGGAITAALFLQRFVNGVPWAHLDIAAVAWRKGGGVATVPEGASGFGVRLLDRFVRNTYEG